MLLLVGQFLVGQILNLHARLLQSGELAEGLVVHQHHRSIAHPQRSGIGRQRVAGLQ